MAAALDRSFNIDTLKAHRHQNICKILPKPLVLARIQRSGRLLCHGLALPQWPFQEWVDQIFRQRQAPSRTTFTAAGGQQRDAPAPPGLTPLKNVLLDATTSALQIGLTLTGIALRLAKRLVDDMRRSITHIQSQTHNSSTAASELMRSAQKKLIQKAKRETLKEQGKDLAFMQMLYNLDRCHMDHEEKWALFRKHCAGKAEFSERWQHLYKLAKESKTAVDTLLRPDASRSEINQFWRSAETSAIIAEENALKQLVFAQVFTAGQS